MTRPAARRRILATAFAWICALATARAKLPEPPPAPPAEPVAPLAAEVALFDPDLVVTARRVAP